MSRASAKRSFVYLHVINWVKENYIYERNAKTEEEKKKSLQNTIL